jgi:ATP-binding cassette subfamily F protein 3
VKTEKPSIETEISKKDKKRLEAEQRNKKYALTKDLKNQVKEVEKKINDLEKKEKEIEQLLLDPSIYDNHQKIMELNSEYQKVKERLTQNLNQWEKISSELQKVEEQFN